MSTLPVVPAAAPGSQPPRLLDHLRDLARRHFGRPEPGDRYADWARRFILFHGKRHPRDLGLPDFTRFVGPAARTVSVTARPTDTSWA